MRDITLGETIDFKFTTCEPDTGAPITFAGSPVISAYVGNSTTQITAGITLSVDFDGVTGLHNVRVVASSGNGFADASDVALIVTTGTVDGVSAVGYKVAEFTIGRAAAHTRLGAAGVGLTALPWNTAWDPHVGKVVNGTLSGTHSDTTADLGASAPTTDVVGQTLYFPTHQLARVITSYNTGTGVATFASIGVTLVNANPWYLFATAPVTGALDAAGIRAAVGLASANLDTQLGDLPTNAELATALGTADDAVLAAIAALNDLSAAEVNAEVVDALATDTYAEPGQGSPGATITLAAKVSYLYKAWRNRSTQTASEYALFADDGTTKDHEAAVSDDGTTLVKGEVTTGA